MRITVTMPDGLERELKTQAANDGKSVSSLVSEAVEYFIREKRRRGRGKKMMGLAGTVKIAPRAYEDLDRERAGNDRP